MKKIITLIFLIIFFNQNQFAQKFRWARIGSDATIKMTVTDTLNNLIVLGSYYTKTFTIGDLSTNSLTEGNEKTFIAKFNSTGKALWLKSINPNDSNSYVSPIKVEVNKSGNVVIALSTNAKSIYINGQKYNISEKNILNFVVLFFHRTGKLLWISSSKIYDRNNFGFANLEDILLTDDNEVFITGTYIGDSMNIGNKLIESVVFGFENFFVARLNYLGSTEWIKSCKVSWVEMGSVGTNKIMYDNDNLYVVGYVDGYLGNIIFSDSMYINNIEGRDLFIACYNKNGDFKWVKKIEGDNTEMIPKIALETNTGNLILAAFFNSSKITVDQSVSVSNSSTYYDLFITSIDKEGNFKWIKSFDTKLVEPAYTNFELLYKKGNLFLVTSFEGENINLDNVSIQNTDNSFDLVILKLNPLNGSIDWYATVQGPFYNEINSIDVDKYGNLNFLTSISSNAQYVKINDNLIENQNNTNGNIFSKLDSNGELKTLKVIFYQTQLDFTSFKKLCNDNFGNVYIVGNFNGLSNLDTITVGLTTGKVYGTFISKLAFTSTIHGKIYNSNGNVVNTGIVKLYGVTKFQKAPLEDSVFISSDGSFLFGNIPFGIYYLFVNPYDNKYLPTYYPNAGYWTDAQPIIILTPNAKEANIILNNSVTLTGNNTLSGMIQESDSLNINNLKSTNKIMKRPIKNATVILISRTKNSNEYGTVVAITYTDDLGNFSFQNIPDGYYTILIDEPGLPHDSYYDIYVSGGKIYGSLDYEVGLEKIYTLNQNYNFIEKNMLNNDVDIEIYPNPIFNNYCYIRINNNQGNKDIKIKLLTITGQVLKEGNYENKENIIYYEIGKLPSGIYLLSISLNDHIVNKKLIVK